MPLYRYEHDCGYSHEQFLQADKESVVMPCLRCGRGVTARQVRDKSAIIKEKDEVKGVLTRDGR